jgi:hypothetical protein
VGGVGAFGVGLLVWSMWPVPQIGADPEAMKTVDALFTAVTSKDERRLTDCEERLRAHEEAGRLPAAAARRLDAVIARARGGEWRPAAETLYSFIRAQRGDGR